MKLKHIYLGGPMRGIPYFNFPTFKVARELLRAQGHTVFCPAENDIRRHGHDFSVNCPKGDLSEIKGSVGFTIERAIYEDLQFISIGGCTTIALLPGWEHSSGASGPEFALAKFLKREFMYLSDRELGALANAA